MTFTPDVAGWPRRRPRSGPPWGPPSGPRWRPRSGVGGGLVGRGVVAAGREGEHGEEQWAGSEDVGAWRSARVASSRPRGMPEHLEGVAAQAGAVRGGGRRHRAARATPAVDGAASGRNAVARGSIVVRHRGHWSPRRYVAVAGTVSLHSGHCIYAMRNVLRVGGGLPHTITGLSALDKPQRSVPKIRSPASPSPGRM